MSITVGGVFTVAVLALGGVDTGWTFYTPYSSTYSNSYVINPRCYRGFFQSASPRSLPGINFIATIHKHARRACSGSAAALFVWAHYATSLIMILGTCRWHISLLLVAIERLFRSVLIRPWAATRSCSSIFLVLLAPAVYIMILPSMGVISELITCFSRKRGFLAIILSLFLSIAIAVIGFLVWGHHMFVSGQSVYAGMIFSILVTSWLSHRLLKCLTDDDAV